MAKSKDSVIIAGTVCYNCKKRYSVTRQGNKGDTIICPHCGAIGEREADG